MAALYGNADIIAALLEAGADANEVGPNTETPIMLAARNGNPAAIRTLLAGGADVNAVENVRGTTALMWAVEQRHPEAVQALIEGGADVSAQSAGAGLPRRYMANRVNIDRVKTAYEQLVEAASEGLTQEEYQARREELGAAGSEPNNPGGAFGIDLDTLATFVLDQLQPGGDVDEVLNDFRDQATGFGIDFEALDAAVRRRLAADQEDDGAGAAAAASPAEGEVGPGAPGGLGRGQGGAEQAADATDAADAADDGEEDGPQAGLVGGGGGGLTPLIYAAREGCLECARILIDAGADPNQQSNYDWTPLMTATNNRWYELGAHLISRGADVNMANMGGMTPLYLATDNRNIEGGDYPVPSADADDLAYIRLLLDSGADPNHQVGSDTETRTIFTMQWFFETGATAFLRASQSGDTALMRLLLEYGADPLIPTEHGDTSLSAASGIGWVEGVTFEWSEEENLEAVRMLLALGADPNSANGDGRTPLMGAAMKGRVGVIEALVDAGGRLETRDNGSRDTDKAGSKLAGHTWQAIDYADGLVRVGVQSAVNHPEVARRIRELMIERGLPVPPPNRVVESICIVAICMEMTYDSIEELEAARER
jgi:ankyrin repeat protein